MSARYICDVCGSQFDCEQCVCEMSVKAYEEKGGVSIGTAWHGDVCMRCMKRIQYEQSRATMREIKTIALRSGYSKDDNNGQD